MFDNCPENRYDGIDRNETAPEDRETGEPVMINVTRMDRDRYFEAVRVRAKSGRNLALTVGGIAVAAIGLLMHSYLAAALGAAVAVLTILQPFLIGRRDFRRLCEIHPGGEWEKTIRFFPDRVESDAGNGRITVASYDSIRREYESESMYVLDFGRISPAAAFSKDGFTRGSLAELKTFLTEVRRAKYAPGKNIDEQAPACERNSEMKEQEK